MSAGNDKLEKRVNALELDVFMLMMEAQDVADAGALWATVCSIAAQSARIRIQELGGDVDKVREAIDKFFLEHPECA